MPGGGGARREPRSWPCLAGARCPVGHAIRSRGSRKALRAAFPGNRLKGTNLVCRQSAFNLPGPRVGGGARRWLGQPETSGSFPARAPPLKAAGTATEPAGLGLHLCPAAGGQGLGQTVVTNWSPAVPSELNPKSPGLCLVWVFLFWSFLLAAISKLKYGAGWLYLVRDLLTPLVTLSSHSVRSSQHYAAANAREDLAPFSSKQPSHSTVLDVVPHSRGSETSGPALLRSVWRSMAIVCCHSAELVPLPVAELQSLIKTVIPLVSAWLLGGFDEHLKIPEFCQQ